MMLVKTSTLVKHVYYTVLTLKYGVNLLNASVSCVLRQNARNFDCDWQRVNVFSHCVTLIRVLLSQIISYSDTKVPVLVVMECKHANVIYVYQLIFLLHTSRSAECRENTPLYKQYGTAKCPCLTCISSIY